MGNKQHPDQLKHAQTWPTRPTIGFLTSEMGGPLQRLMWLGASDLAQERDANLIVFPGGALRDSRGFEAQANSIFDLVNVDRLDGLVILSGTLDWFISHEEMAAFCRRYHALPVVSGLRAFEGIPTVLMDNYQGMRQIMLHLIEHHGYRRIAFIRGPEGHVGAQERYRAYIETLAAYGIPFDPTLVPLPGIDWEKAAAAAMVRQLLDERNVKFEAVAAANDALAIGVLEALQGRGISVPYDVAVVGFDDQIDSKCVTPPLTTIRASHYEMGRQAVELLLRMLGGEHVPDCVTVPARLVVRQSCGCLTPEVIEAAAGQVVENREPFEIVLTAQREEILSTMTLMGGTAIVGRNPNWATPLLDKFIADLKGQSSGIFLRELDKVLRQVMAVGDDVGDWHGVLSALRRQILPCLSDRAMLCRAEDLWQQARIVIGETTQRVQAYHVVLAEQQAQILREIEAALITTFDVSELMDALFEGLPRLGIPGVYLSLYHDPKRPTDKSNLILAYNEHGRGSLEQEERCFPSSQLVPDGFLPKQRPYHFIVMPLYFRENQIGFVVFEAGLRDGKSYEALRGQISSALQGALLVQRVQERSAEIARQKYILDTFMANVPDFIYFKDRDSRFIRSNQAHAQLFGLHDPAQLVGKSDFDFYPAEQVNPRYAQEQEIIRTGQPLLNFEESNLEGTWTMTTKMPLRDEDGAIIGTFGISRDITPLKQAQMELAAAYEEIRMMNEQLKDENIRMHTEMNLARQIQTALLPQTLRGIHPDFDIAAAMFPAEEVGGDYYDVALDLTGALWLGIGDVSGHGVTPGLIMMMAQTVHTAITTNFQASPREVVTRINRVLYKNVQGRLHEDQFMTFTTLKYLGNGRFQHAGSHLELIVYRQSTGQCELIDTPGTWLNLLPDIADCTENAEFTLAPGDILVLYTDGLTEAQNHQHELLDLPRLTEMVQTHAGDDVDAMRDGILADVLDWCARQQDDDMSLVVARRVH